MICKQSQSTLEIVSKDQNGFSFCTEYRQTKDRRFLRQSFVVSANLQPVTASQQAFCDFVLVWTAQIPGHCSVSRFPAIDTNTLTLRLILDPRPASQTAKQNS